MGVFALLCSTPPLVKFHVHVAVVRAFGGWPHPTPNPSGYVFVLVPLIVVRVASSSIAGNCHGWTDASLVRPETSVTRIDPRGAPRWPSAPMRRRSGPSVRDPERYLHLAVDRPAFRLLAADRRRVRATETSCGHRLHAPRRGPRVVHLRRTARRRRRRLAGQPPRVRLLVEIVRPLPDNDALRLSRPRALGRRWSLREEGEHRWRKQRDHPAEKDCAF